MVKYVRRPLAPKPPDGIVAGMTNRAPQALEGVTVLDLSRVLAGPWASQLLGDLGAAVVKIERPGAGDDTRGWGPPFVENEQGFTTDAAYFLAANRNKQSVAIDIATQQGAALIRRLAAKADVLLENFKVGGLSKYDLDYDSLRVVNPRLVYCSITGFGQTGPYKNRPGYDFMIQAMGGVMSVTGQPAGAPGDEPLRAGVSVADLFSGMYAASAILAALRHAERTGEGQHIDVSLFDCQIAMLANQASNYLISGAAPQRLGNTHPNLAPYGVFETADAHIVVAVGNDRQFAILCDVLGVPHIGVASEFAQNRDRVANREKLIPLITETMRQKTAAEWLDAFEKAGVPAGPINSIDDVFNDPQAQSRQMTTTLKRNREAPQQYVSHPVKYSRTPPQGAQAPPALGAHTDAVLRALLGLGDHDLAELRARRIID